MLAIVLTVLKIIGIILLCLVLIILVVAGLILFVPVRYRANGYYHDDYAVNGKLSWLLHFITVRVSLQKDKDLQFIVRVLGIPVYDMQKKKYKAAKKAAEDSKKKKATEAAGGEVDAVPEAELTVVKPPVPHRPGSEEKKAVLEETAKSETDSKASVAGDETADDIEQNLTEEEHGRLGLIAKCKASWEKCKQRITNIKYTFTKICDKIKNIKDNITYYMELLQKENTKQAFAACKKELLRIWKDIKPKKFKVNVLLGMDDPATTGQIIGYCAMLYPLHQGNITVVPEFETKVFEADFSLKGKLTVYVYLIVAYTILFNKNIRRLKKCLLREDS